MADHRVARTPVITLSFLPVFTLQAQEGRLFGPLALTKTYAVRMAAVFMMSLATIWLKTGLMRRWLVFTTYGAAVGLLLSSDLSMWIALVFPAWVLLVSVLALVRSGVIDLRHDDPPR